MNNMMDRRQAISWLSSILGGTIIGGQAFISGCSLQKEKDKRFTINGWIPTLDEIGEIILPESDQSPGAKQAAVGKFMISIVKDCYTAKEESTFLNGLEEINNAAENEFADTFIALDSEDKIKLVQKIDREAQTNNQHYFMMIKQLTLWAYFTSEVAARNTLRYVPIPGRYEGCIPYDGKAAWF